MTRSPRSTCWPPTSTVVLEGDITACFDEIDHPALMGRVRDRIGTSASWAWSRRSCMPVSSPRTASPGTPRWAPRKAASSRRCWPTSPCRFSTITSPRPGRRDMATRPRARRRRHGGRHVSPGALRGRLRGAWWRAPRRTPRSLQDRGGSGALHDGPAPVGGEDDDRPHRRGVRLPRLPHPAADQARIEQGVRLHLAVRRSRWPRSRPR